VRCCCSCATWIERGEDEDEAALLSCSRCDGTWIERKENLVCVALEGRGAVLPTFRFTRVKSRPDAPVLRFFIAQRDNRRKDGARQDKRGAETLLRLRCPPARSSEPRVRQ
jgi:hypothetical protein